ncbi:MAG: glycosyltransferase family 2 protein [Kastovskya adunca ATA6-11-RM4]|jgi:glycosyltransferase Alg8|nr:glycosyltransferase family 2 protein [Kastovskya adunca ATA6-11-RM4]
MKSTSSNSENNFSAFSSGLWAVFTSIVGFLGLVLLRDPDRVALLGVSGLIGMGMVGMWRWSWWVFQVIRSRIYLHWVFPRWRRRANKIPVEQLPTVCLLVPTYKEQPWITERVFKAIALEAKTLTKPIVLLVTSSSNEENAAILEVLKSVDPELSSIHLIQMVQTGEGKRKAMSDGLRELARLNLPKDAIVALMDGDSELTPGTLRGCLPFFRVFPKMGALTTDELPIVKGSYVFSEWFHLRMSQRHYQMCSVSLSSKIMCLTGRFSLFRAEAALHPTFATQLENDTLDDWLWGRFKFLSGDDKSTWYWLLQRGYDMIYVPDVIVYSIETISGSLVDRAYQNMRRWYGNMLRNSDRAIGLGPRKTGFFVWYCLIDQRISYWTSLFTPSLLLITMFQRNWIATALLIAWVIFSRPLMLIVIFFGRQSHLKPIHFPLLLVCQWISSLIKIWTQMNLAQQKWSNRGNQSITAEGKGLKRVAKVGTSRFLIVTQLFTFAIILCSFAGILHPARDFASLWNTQVVVAKSSPVERVVEATDYGVVPNDGKDDAVALQALLDQLPPQGKVKINLPIGELDLFKPLEISRSHTILNGEGVRRTILLVHNNLERQQAALFVRPRPDSSTPAAQNTLQDVQVMGFTLRHVSPKTASDSKKPTDSIILENVAQVALKKLNLNQSSRHALVLNNTQNVTIEQVAIDNNSQQKQLVQKNSVNTQVKALTLPDLSS